MGQKYTISVDLLLYYLYSTLFIGVINKKKCFAKVRPVLLVSFITKVMLSNMFPLTPLLHNPPPVSVSALSAALHASIHISL